MSFGNVIFAQDLFFQGGLATVENGSATVTGSFNAAAGTTTSWGSAALEGDTIAIGSTRHYIKRIVSDVELELTEPWSGPDATASGYTGARAPWHLADRALASLPVIGPGFASFLLSIPLALFGPAVPLWMSALNPGRFNPGQFTPPT